MKYINPDRKLADKFLLYTEREGGDFKFIADFSWGQYYNLLKKGYFTHRLGDGTVKIYPAYATICEALEGYDFRIAELNGEKKEKKPRKYIKPYFAKRYKPWS